MNCYDDLRRLMNDWNGVVQDDVCLVVIGGWSKAARPPVLAGKRQLGESCELTVRRKRHEMGSLPSGIVAVPYIVEEERDVQAFVEECTGDDGLLVGPRWALERWHKQPCGLRARRFRGRPVDPDESDESEVCLDLMKSEATATKAAKRVWAVLDVGILARRSILGPSDVSH